MRLIERVCEENLLNPQVLAPANENSRVKSDMGQVQRLSKMNLLDEDSLLKLFSSRYGIPMLSEASQVLKTRPEVDQVKTIFEATQILPILQETGMARCLESIQTGSISQKSNFTTGKT